MPEPRQYGYLCQRHSAQWAVVDPVAERTNPETAQDIPRRTGLPGLVCQGLGAAWSVLRGRNHVVTVTNAWQDTYEASLGG